MDKVDEDKVDKGKVDEDKVDEDKVDKDKVDEDNVENFQIFGTFSNFQKNSDFWKIFRFSLKLVGFLC